MHFYCQLAHLRPRLALRLRTHRNPKPWQPLRQRFLCLSHRPNQNPGLRPLRIRVRACRLRPPSRYPQRSQETQIYGLCLIAITPAPGQPSTRISQPIPSTAWRWSGHSSFPQKPIGERQQSKVDRVTAPKVASHQPTELPRIRYRYQTGLNQGLECDPKNAFG